MTIGEGTRKSPQSRRTSHDAEFQVTFGQRIKAVRVAAKMSQSALGEALGVTYQQVQKFEAGKDRMSVGALQRMAVAFGVHPGSFFTDDGGEKLGSMKDLRQAQRIGERIARLRNPLLLRRLLALVDALAGAEAARTNGAGEGYLPARGADDLLGGDRDGGVN